MENIKFTVSKNVVTLPEVEGVDSFLIEASVFHDSVHISEMSNFKADEYTPGTQVTVDAESIKQVAVWAVIGDDAYLLRKAKINEPWTGLFDENYVSSKMFLEQANDNTFPKPIVQEQVEEEVEEPVEVEETSDNIEIDEQDEISAEKWDDYNADARIAVLKEIHPNVEIILDLDENSMSLGRCDYRSTVRVKVNPLHLETTSFDEFCEEFDNVIDFSRSRKHRVEARVIPTEEEQKRHEEDWAKKIERAKKIAESNRLKEEAANEIDEQDEVEEALAMAEEYKTTGESFIQEKTVAELSDIMEKANLINHMGIIIKIQKELERRKNPVEQKEKDWEWLEPGTPEYYEYEYLPQLSLEALVAELNTLVNSLKQGKVRYQEMQTVEGELNKRMHGNNEYRVERLIHFMVKDNNDSERKEIERIQKEIADEIVAAEARWEQHDIDVILGRINPYENEDPLDLLLDDISVMLSSIQNYGDEFMNWINSEQEDAPF